MPIVRVLVLFLLVGQERRRLGAHGRLQVKASQPVSQFEASAQETERTHVAVTVAGPSSSSSSAAAVRVPMVPMPGRKHADEVDGEPDGAHREELARVHLGRVDEPLDGLEDDEDRDEAQEDAVGEPRERLDPRVAAR